MHRPDRPLRAGNGNAADVALTRLEQTDPSISSLIDPGAVLKAGLPDAERGTTGTVNRQPTLLTAATFPWQATCRCRVAPGGTPVNAVK
jgi:hypothetical protein